MTNRELDRWTAEYLDAFDAFDVAELERIWEYASREPQLEAALLDLHVALEREAEELEQQTAESAIISAVEKHLPSAEIVRPVQGPITVADVAGELFRHTPDRLNAEAHALNDRLRTSREPLPVELGLSKLVAWAEAKYGPGALEYWRAFRVAALKLELRRGAETEYQLAARTAPKPEDRK